MGIQQAVGGWEWSSVGIMLSNVHEALGLCMKHHITWAWGCTSVTLALRRRRQKGQEFKASLGSITGIVSQILCI